MRRWGPLLLGAWLSGCAPTNLGQASLVRAGSYRLALEDQDETRTFELHLPAPSGELGGRPLLVALHGGGSSGAEMEAVTGFSALADREGFVAVYPDGMGPHGFGRAWNPGRCCSMAYFLGVDDVAFVDHLIAALVARLGLDAKRLYLVGYSSGGGLAQRAYAHGGHAFAGVGLFGATRTGSGLSEAPTVEWAPRYGTQLVLVHGREDPRVAYRGGERRQGIALSFEQGARAYAGELGCRRHGWWETSHAGTVWARQWNDCAKGGAILAITLQGWGHEWPSLSNFEKCLDPRHPLLGFDTAEAMWRWFATPS